MGGERERSGEMDRIAAEVLSLFLNHQGNGETKRNVKMEAERNIQRDQEGLSLMENVRRVKQRERDKETGKRGYFFLLVFSILRSPLCCLGTIAQEVEG